MIIASTNIIKAPAILGTSISPYGEMANTGDLKSPDLNDLTGSSPVTGTNGRLSEWSNVLVLKTSKG